jgi:UDP-N-acetylmuramoyl-L-alanyl-D-glutamate--2,6-diaminopimelate ligase
MHLSKLFSSDISVPASHAATEVRSIATDSRKIEPGALFFALAGSKTDGARFIADAVTRGAVAIVAGPEAETLQGAIVPVIKLDDPRRALALAAARFYEVQPKTIVAVTGTSGKTSVAEFTRQILAICGRQAASLGTIGVVKPGGAIYGALTTPDPVTLHATLADLAREGLTHVAMEASSHGLDQHRLDGVRLTAAAFTNLGRDHMDYHPTVEHYLSAKLRLFTELLQPGQTAVVNLDGAHSSDVMRAVNARGLSIIQVGTSKGATLRLAACVIDGFKQCLAIEQAGRVHHVDLPLVGGYQVENALTAAGLSMAAGEHPEAVLAALGKLQGVKGRLEIVGQSKGALAIVDYAHKPEALIAALDACRPFVRGRLICVFGCGGDRDKGKRPIMGRIAAKHADVVIITDDNPRSEDPATIRAEILAASPGALEIGDRRAAVEKAVSLMNEGDVVLVAGKGHETGQIVGDTVLPFSDHDVLRAALAET